MNKFKQFVIQNKAVIAVLIIGIVVYILTSKKAMDNIKKVTGNIIPQKPTTLKGFWKASTAPERTKEVSFNDKVFTAQVKSIKGYDTALLPNDNVVIYENGVGQWVQAMQSDLD